MGTELVGDRLSRGTNQLGTNCEGPNVRGPYLFGTKSVTAQVIQNLICRGGDKTEIWGGQKKIGKNQ